MTPDRLKEIIDAYGAAPHRWPEAERVAAQALLASDATLAAYQEAAGSLDAAMDAVPVVDVPAGLAHTILADAASHAKADVARTGTASAGLVQRLVDMVRQALPEMPVWQPAIGFAASLAMGIWVGAQGVVPLTGQADETEIAILLDDEGDALSLVYGYGLGFGEWAHDG